MRINLGLIIYLVLALATISSCKNQPSADEIQTRQQETLNMEATRSVGMPNIRNFRERRLVKDILELRDQENFQTYTYIHIEGIGLVFLCHSLGYAIPYTTQFTNPEKIAYEGTHYGITLPQADPNNLFSPSSAEASWVMCQPPGGGEAKVVYAESRLVTSPFQLPGIPLTHQQVSTTTPTQAPPTSPAAAPSDQP